MLFAGDFGRSSYVTPYTEPPLNYDTLPVNDPVAQFQQRIDRGEASLQWDDEHGYLKSLLDQLNIPVSSQTLVFSRTSFQNMHISPATPRALYYNDDVYIGWVQNGDFIEIASVDAAQGTIFYTLKQDKPAIKPQPQ